MCESTAAEERQSTRFDPRLQLVLAREHQQVAILRRALDAIGRE